MMWRVRLDHEENHATGKEPSFDPTYQHVAVLADVKAKPSVAAEAASLDIVCARRPQRYAVGAEESLRRGRTKEMPKEEQCGLTFSPRLENQKSWNLGPHVVDAPPAAASNCQCQSTTG